MPTVLVLFHDGEMLHADVEDVALDLPVLQAVVRSVDSNSERAILPLAAIRELIIGEPRPAPVDPGAQGWDRAAFHYLDGQVLRAWVGPEVRLGRHGGVWGIVEPGGSEQRTLAIPYSSLKGVFRLRQWDGRPATERLAGPTGTEPHLEHLVTALAEREARALGRGRRSTSPLLDRIRGATGDGTVRP